MDSVTPVSPFWHGLYSDIRSQQKKNDIGYLNFHIKSRDRVQRFTTEDSLKYKANVFYFATHVETVHLRIVTQHKDAENRIFLRTSPILSLGHMKRKEHKTPTQLLHFARLTQDSLYSLYSMSLK